MRTNPVIKYWTIALIGVVISFALFYLINDKKIQKNNIAIDNAIAKAELQIEDELQKIDLVIESMSFFFDNSPVVSQKTFEEFTNPFKEDLNGIKALEWAPSILGNEKKEFVLSRTNESPADILETDQSNSLISSGIKDQYFPIQLINPYNELQDILGYDIYSEITRSTAIDQSTSSRNMAFTGPIELVDNDNGVPGFLAMKTVFEPNGIKVKGIVAVVYRMDDFLNKTINDEFKVIDLTVNDLLSENATLFSSIDGKDYKKGTVRQRSNIAAANRIWTVSFYPKPAYVGFPNIAESYFVLLLGLLITLLLIVNIKGRDDRSQDLETKVWNRTKELEVSNKQKENLLREIHHRVMNNLQITSSLMNLQKRKLQDEEAIYALSSSQDRINAIALIHQKIYQHDGADAVDLKGYLENLINSHKRISPDVGYVIDCPEVFIDLDSAVPLAIITSEIVVNALKHAFKKSQESKQLYILVTPMKNDVLDLVISDNGSGLPKNNEIGETKGLGYDIVKKLCRQLQAEYEFSSSSSGTSFSMRFKQRKLEIPVFA